MRNLLAALAVLTLTSAAFAGGGAMSGGSAGGGSGSGSVTSVSGTSPIQVANPNTTPALSLSGALPAAATITTANVAAGGLNTPNGFAALNPNGYISTGSITPTPGVQYSSGASPNFQALAISSPTDSSLVSTHTAVDIEMPALTAQPTNLGPNQNQIWCKTNTCFVGPNQISTNSSLGASVAMGGDLTGNSNAATIQQAKSTFSVVAASFSVGGSILQVNGTSTNFNGGALTVGPSTMTANLNIALSTGNGLFQGGGSTMSVAGNIPAFFADSTTVLAAGGSTSTFQQATTMDFSTASIRLSDYLYSPGDSLVIKCHFRNAPQTATGAQQSVRKNGVDFAVVQNQTSANQDINLSLRFQRVSTANTYQTDLWATQVIGNGSGGAVTSQVIFNNTSTLLTFGQTTQDRWTCAGTRSAGGDVMFVGMSVRKE